MVGAGAIGTALAGRLHAAGHDVSVLARGARRDFIADHGLSLTEAGASFTFHPALAELEDLAIRDLVIVAVKSGSLQALLPQLAHAMRPDALLMPAINGLPWWYFLGEDGSLDGRSVRAVDRTGELGKLFNPERLIGCVLYSRATMLPTGAVAVSGQDLHLGAIAGDPPLAAIAAQFEAAGISVTVEADIRRAMWRKLVRNAATNVVSALTDATMEQMGQDIEVTRVITDIALEVAGLAARVGRAVDPDLEEMVGVLKTAGPFATSMLQDVRSGREPELDAIADAPLELADLLGHEMPTLRTTVALLRLSMRMRRAAIRGNPAQI